LELPKTAISLAIAVNRYVDLPQPVLPPRRGPGINVLAQDWENNDQQGRLQQFGQNLAH